MSRGPVIEVSVEAMRWIVLIGLLIAVPAAAETGTATPGVDASALLRVIGGLVFVVAVILVLSWGLRRVGTLTGSVSGRLRVLGSVPVGNRERAVLVQVGEQQLLLGVAPGNVRTLHVLDEPVIERAPAAGGAAQSGSFADRLRAVMRQDGKR